MGTSNTKDLAARLVKEHINRLESATELSGVLVTSFSSPRMYYTSRDGELVPTHDPLQASCFDEANDFSHLKHMKPVNPRVGTDYSELTTILLRDAVAEELVAYREVYKTLVTDEKA